jgi:hypothetical protein
LVEFKIYVLKRNLGTLDEARKLFGPHKEAILDFDWKNSLAVSGDKSGIVAFWDINEGVAVQSKKVIHDFIK